jgi:enolase-phosphatase E1
MPPLSARGILLDIEGTTSSVSSVYDVMFPFVRRELTIFLKDHWQEPEVLAAAEQIARDAGHENLLAMCSAASARDDWQAQHVIEREVLSLMDRDVKATGLKQLQGLIWQAGFESGELQAHVYDDVPPALAAWNAAGKDVRIYSSGSIQAQKLFFGHTVAGNLLGQFRGHYDTTTGPKKEAESYRKIAADMQLSPGDVLFASDIVAELEAARGAGLQTVLVVRPGNAPQEQPADQPHAQIASFAELEFSAGRNSR